MPTSEALSKASRGTCISTRIVPLPLRRVLAPYHSEHQAVVFLLRVLRSGPSSMSRSVGSTSSIDGSADTFFSGAAIRDRAADNALAFRECGDDATEVAYALRESRRSQSTSSAMLRRFGRTLPQTTGSRSACIFPGWSDLDPYWIWN